MSGTATAEQRTDRGRRLVAAGLLAGSAAGTASMLLAPASASPDVTFPLLAIAVVPLAGLVAHEHRRPSVSPNAIQAVAAGLVVLAVVRPPHGSNDVWSYAMYGRIVAAYHLSPYLHVPAQFALDPILRRVAPGWRTTPSVYGPGFTALSAGIMAFAGRSAVVARIGFQAVAGLSVLAAGAALVRNRVPSGALASVVLNPLVLVWVVNGGHNDALVGLTVVVAAVAVRADRSRSAGLVLGAGVLVKAVAVLPAAACFAWVWRHRGPRPAILLAAFAGGPVALGYASSGGMAAVSPLLGSAGRQSRVSVWRLLLARGADLPAVFSMRDIALVAAAAAVGLTAVLIAVRVGAESATPVLVASLAGYLLLAGYVLPWYFAWVLPLAALDHEAGLSRLLALQTVGVLIAYQYQATGHPDDLDRVLRAGPALAQVVAIVGSMGLMGAAVAQARQQRRIAPGT